MKMLLKVVLLAFLYLMLFLSMVSQAHSEIIPEEKSESIKEYAERRVSEEFGEREWIHFNTIVKRESKWNSKAQNPYSSAYGLCQFLNKTWKSTSYKKTSDPRLQIEACIEYIRDRYDSPHKAKLFHDKANWY